MPGFNGTGPMGAGPMTGGGRGNCNPTAGGYGRPRFGQGLGLGFRGGYGSGQGFGQGQGLGRRGFYPTTNNVPYAAQPQDELNMLKNQAEAISNELDAINQRITQLKSATKQ